jgi:hypothetical protein
MTKFLNTIITCLGIAFLLRKVEEGNKMNLRRNFMMEIESIVALVYIIQSSCHP